MSTDATADAASCSTLATFISTLENSELKIWKHIRHCLSSDKAIAIQEAQKLLCVDAAAFDAENLCKWSLACFMDIFLRIFVPISLIWNDSARRVKYATHVLYSHSSAEKALCIHFIEICCKSEMLIKVIVIGY